MKYTITLEYAGTHYSFEDPYDYTGWDEERDADYQISYMYTEGNYGCDCNCSDFLYQYCGVDFKDDPRAELDMHYEGGAWTLPCGDTIKLVAIRQGERIVWPELKAMKTAYIQQANGLFVPIKVFEYEIR